MRIETHVSLEEEAPTPAPEAAVLLQEALLVTIEKDKLEQLQEPQPLFCLLSFVVESFSSTCSFSASGNVAACGIARC